MTQSGGNAAAAHQRVGGLRGLSPTAAKLQEVLLVPRLVAILESLFSPRSLDSTELQGWEDQCDRATTTERGSDVRSQNFDGSV